MTASKKHSKSRIAGARPAVTQALTEKRVLLFKRLAAVIVLALLLGSITITARSMFTVQVVHCTVEQQACPADIDSRLSRLADTPILGHDFKQTSNSELADTAFRVASWQSQLPGTLLVQLQEDPAVYELTTSDARVFVSSTGVVTTAPEESTQQLLRVATNQQLADVLETDGAMQERSHAALLKLVAAVQAETLPVSTVEWNDQTVQLNLADEVSVLLLISDVPSQLERATLVLDSPEFAERAAELRILDLRFRLPVLRNSL